MNLWRNGPIYQNPYYRTAFRIGRVPREMSRHRTLVKCIGQTRKIVNNTPDRHVVNGEPVSMAELNSAEEILLDPLRRIREELLHHATEPPPIQRIKQLAEQILESLSEVADNPLEIRDFSWIDEWTAHLSERSLDDQPLTEQAFGPDELEIAPPFGKPDEERNDA